MKKIQNEQWGFTVDYCKLGNLLYVSTGAYPSDVGVIDPDQKLQFPVMSIGRHGSVWRLKNKKE